MKRILTDVVTIDPGLGGTGWAYWYSMNVSPTNITKKARPPDFTGVLRVPKKIKDWEDKAYGYSKLFEQLVKRSLPEADEDGRLFVIEFPQLFSSSSISFASAQRGDLFKLSYLVGMYSQIIYSSKVPSEIDLVSPNAWKGQLTKKATNKRIMRTIKKKYRDHEADAVGIGLYLQGKL